jgi:hypothetical protein
VKQAPKKRDLSSSKSSLAPQLVELMKMLFNVETYKYLSLSLNLVGQYIERSMIQCMLCV